MQQPITPDQAAAYAAKYAAKSTPKSGREVEGEGAPAPSPETVLTVTKWGCYLPWIEERERAMVRIQIIRSRIKKEVERDALWDAWYALRVKRDELVEAVVERGCLLHVGVPGALR